ncbi:MAG: hypothetical protein M3R47_17640 [Chloroflexota bacterium]|nr:hypothetical protein [Chloroflexota bacterium]
MRLNKSQKEALLSWVAEGLKTDEINKRAGKFKPRFDVSTRIVAYYRKSREWVFSNLTSRDIPLDYEAELRLVLKYKGAVVGDGEERRK